MEEHMLVRRTRVGPRKAMIYVLEVVEGKSERCVYRSK